MDKELEDKAIIATDVVTVISSLKKLQEDLGDYIDNSDFMDDIRPYLQQLKDSTEQIVEDIEAKDRSFFKKYGHWGHDMIWFAAGVLVTVICDWIF